MATSVSWVMLHYGIDGNPILANDTYNALGPDTNVLLYATDRTMTHYLNNFDELTFNLYLDDAAALGIRRGTSVVKVFRTVLDVEASINYTPDDPVFCGIVGYTLKDGENSTMQVKCYSPLWRLQSHFHIDNHYLQTNIDTGQDYTQSELMWKLIDLVNNAFGSDSFTGIRKGTFNWGLPEEPQPTPYFVGAGSNTWSNIFDDLLARDSSPDIIPEYKHTDGQPLMMNFSTDKARGSDISDDVLFSYHANPIFNVSNLDGFTHQEQISPGTYGNFIWVVGQGGPNSGRVAARQTSDSSFGSDGIGEVGVYMVRVDRSEVKLIPAIGHIADAEQKKRIHPMETFTVSISPAGHLYWGVHFGIGDIVMLFADKGALNVASVKNRIYQITVSMSENGVETCEVLLSSDLVGKVDTL